MVGKSSILSYWDLIKFPYFKDSTKKIGQGVKGGPKTGWTQGDFMDISIISKIWVWQPQFEYLKILMVKYKDIMFLMYLFLLHNCGNSVFHVFTRYQV
jgi:hypothetical protein